MPGVPSGRGCDGCRKQKKKCDEGSPSCSRCIRLGLQCIGAGLRRYKFTQPMHGREHRVKGVRCAKEQIAVHTIVVYRAPTNPQSALLDSFGAAISPAGDRRFCLSYGYGDYLLDLGRFLGTNEALDAAVATVTEVHSLYCRRLTPTAGCLRTYCDALRKLRLSLDDPAVARSDATLYAVMVLMVCQDLMGQTRGVAASHGEGAAQLLKARHNRWPSGGLGYKLALSVTTSVLVEALFNKNIRFSAAEIHAFNSLLRDGTGAAGTILGSMCDAYNYITTVEQGYTSVQDAERLLHNVRATRQTVVAARQELQDLVQNIERRLEGEESNSVVLAAAVNQLKRLDTLTVSMCILSNLVAYAVDIGNRTVLASENIALIEEALVTAEDQMTEVPLGATHVRACLSIAWLAAVDLPIRADVEEAMIRYHIATTPQPDFGAFMERLEQMAQQFYSRLYPPQDSPQLVLLQRDDQSDYTQSVDSKGGIVTEVLRA